MMRVIVKCLNLRKKIQVENFERAQCAGKAVCNRANEPQSGANDFHIRMFCPLLTQRLVGLMPPNRTSGGSCGRMILASSRFRRDATVFTVVELDSLPEKLCLSIDDELSLHFMVSILDSVSGLSRSQIIVRADHHVN